MIPNTFEAEIVRHIGSNILAARNISFRTPLIECISGPPGMGKTYQTHIVLKKLGVVSCDLPGSSFESENAGVPADSLYECYCRASKYWQKGIPAAIVIDDADAAIGQWGDMTQYTVNRQLVCSTLMSLADNPKVAYLKDATGKIRGQTETARVPIIMTCNDSTKLYAPIMRPGRTRTFVWNPSPAEMECIVSGIFPCLDLEEVGALIDEMDRLYAERRPRHLGGAPASLYSDIRSSVTDEALCDMFRGLTAKQMMELDFNTESLSNWSGTVEELVAVGERLITAECRFVEV